MGLLQVLIMGMGQELILAMGLCLVWKMSWGREIRVSTSKEM
jgi:hypothetical protein